MAVPATADEPVAHTAPLALPSGPEWTDLALNRPGQGVRAQAASLLADMKAQSKVGTFLKRAFDTKTDERAFRVGAGGEESVGARLERLTKQGWYVLHSIPVGSRGSDIDHLVITKGGVYPVNTKRHPGGKVWVGERAILVNGQKTDYLRNSRYEGERVRKALLAHSGVEVPVRAVLVFLTGTVLPQVTIKQMPGDVLVLDRMDVPGAFKRAPERLTPEMIEQVYEVARRSTTWT
ncbi:MAG: nuclease-related domain-containing protein [Mycobacteriales bacterium]